MASKSKTSVAGNVIGTFIHYAIMLWACVTLWGHPAFWALAAIAAGNLAVTFAKAAR